MGCLLSILSSLFHYDPVSVCLAGLVVPAAWSGRSGEGWRWWVALVAGLAGVLLVPSSAVAVALGSVVGLERVRCPLWWAFPALFCFALVGGSTDVWGQTIAFLALLPVLFLSVLTRPVFPALLAVMMVSVMWHMQAVDAAVCALGILGFVILGLVGNLGRGVVPGALGVVRPAVLSAVMVAAEHNGMLPGARIALEAVLLDLVLLTVGGFSDRLMRLVRLPFPPFPGFVVLWLGLHTALGLTAGVQGWSVMEVLVALLIGVLSLVDLLPAGREAGQGVRPGVLAGLVVGCVVLGPAVVFGVLSPALQAMGGEWVWPVWKIGGGDGAFLRLPGIMVLMGGIWLVLVKPWQVERGLEKALAEVAPVLGRVRGEEAGVFDGRFVLPWLIRRVVVVFRGRWRAFLALRPGRLPDVGQMGFGVWLVVLAIVLAVLGLAS